jgi:hypothetical protein
MLMVSHLIMDNDWERSGQWQRASASGREFEAPGLMISRFES